MARDRGRAGCAVESLQRAEPLIGTASRVRRWLLIEQEGPWGRDALTESRLAAPIAAEIGDRATEHGVRVLVIRRSPREASPGHTAFLVRSDRDHHWVERLDLERADDLLDVDLDLLRADRAPGAGRAVPSLYLVCTNGRHDPCCADFGRPVVRALRTEGIDVWESSHVGGDRFAANVVCLPTGVYFGRVSPEDAARIIAEHDAGLLDLDRYRGRSCYPPLVQAAEIFARQAVGERRLGALLAISAVKEGPDAATVVLARGADRLEVDVVRELGASEQLTCAAAVHRPWHYRLVDLRTG